jgi:potassium efflux system protein
MRMRWIAARGTVLALGILLTISLSATGDEPRDDVRAPATAARPAESAASATPPESPPTEKKNSESSAERISSDPTDPELLALKKAAVARLKEIDEASKPDQKGQGPEKEKLDSAKELSELLKQRLSTLELIESTLKNRKQAASPEKNPARDEAELKAARDRAQASLERARKEPANLLPEEFRRDTTKTAVKEKDGLLNKLKEQLAAAQDSVKEHRDALEALKSSLSARGGKVAARKADRDAVRQRLTALATRKTDVDSKLASATSAEAREIARERIVNIEWETRLETERLNDSETRIKLETQRDALADLDLQVKEAQFGLADLAARELQTCHKKLADQLQQELEKIAAENKAHAAKANDPIERYKAKRIVDVATLHKLALEAEQELAQTPKYTSEEQRVALEREQADFDALKKLVQGGRSTNVVANRMNLTFRRLSSRRASLARDQLGEIVNLVTKYDNSLTDVELAQLNDSNESREAYQALIESLPPAQHARAKEVNDGLERRYQEHLENRRKALVALADRTEAVRVQMVQRLKLMDEELAYVRTHIFWVRDSVPLGPAALAQISLEGRRVVLAAADIADDLLTRARWSQMSGEFVLSLIGVVTLPIVLHQARRWLRGRLKQSASAPPSAVAVARSIALHVGVSALWPLYIFLWAYAARMAPWPRSTARPVSFADGVLAGALFVAALARFAFGTGGLAESFLRMPTHAARQLRRAIWILTGASLVLLLPDWLLQHGLIMLDARPVSAPVISRMFLLGFEVVAWITLFRLVRSRSPLIVWLRERAGSGVWAARHHRALAWMLLAAVGSVIGLDVAGYDFTARRVSSAGLQSAALLGGCGLVYWLIVQSIEKHAWRWVRVSLHSASDSGLDPSNPDDLATRLRGLAAWVVPIAGLFAGCWVWNIDLALFQSIGEQRIPGLEQILVGDMTKATIIFALTFAAWRHLGALFAIAVFPRLSDDQGLRFAVLTLCRYFVLGAGSLAGLSAVHLGWAQIQYVMAALGVGLGFGLQEVISNFVCGIILLVERPVRVGDIVTVSGMSGKVERINIRATTITNAENQSMIVPNRDFITSNLVNWTHKDRIVRVAIEVAVAYGTDPDMVSELLLTIAREDPDVLRNPMPTALMQAFGTSSLGFALHVFVPDPSLSGRVKHRLCREIQARFESAGIEIPLPAHELHVRTADAEQDLTDVFRHGNPSRRADAAHLASPAPHPIPVSIPAPAEECHRGVDE